MVKSRGKRNRQRGQEYEREIVDWFGKQGFWDARRNLQSQGGKVVGNDLANVPFAVECKRTSAPLMPKAVKALEQCDEDAKAIRCPHPRVVITRADGGGSYVAMTLEDFGKLVRKAVPEGDDIDYNENGW